MSNNFQYPTDIAIDKSYNIEFNISADMVERFATLSGDTSSLHTNEVFSRRSMYRKNVIHGMLPVAFISALKDLHIPNYKYSFEQISANFIKPAFVNDKLHIASKIIDIDFEQKRLELEYSIKNIKSNATLTTGYYCIKYSPLTNKKLLYKQYNPKASMVIDHLEEQTLQFDEIEKGDKKSFHFMISEDSSYSLYEILIGGLSSNYFSELSNWVEECDTKNLLATLLFSTFVGICIPGRYATFINFSATFNKQIKLNNKYKIIGNVAFKSQSTSTLVENISLQDLESNQNIYASGKINVKVNEPPIKMPTIEFLKNSKLDLGLKDKIVLITGGSRGIGETMAKLFSLYSAKVFINYFQGKEDANRIVNEITNNGGEAFAIQADVSDREQVNRMITMICDKFNRVDILVNNAVRNFSPVSFLELTWDEIQKDIDITIKGAFNCCQLVIPIMIKNKCGKIINITTVATDIPPANQTKYVVSKSALVGLTRCMAVEFAKHNIQVNMVTPSFVETDLTKHVSKIFVDKMIADTPMKRNATPGDVANAVIFLASSMAQFTTGQRIVLSGGNPPFI